MRYPTTQVLTVVNLACMAIAVLVATGMVFFFFRSSPTIDTSYRDPTKPVEERVSMLLSQMTLEEKLGQMALVEKNSVHRIADVADFALGAVLSGSGGKPDTNTPEGWRAMTDAFHTAAEKSRLGIPLFYGADANHGHSNVPGATVFPHQLGLAATNNSELVHAIAHATAREMRATGVNWNYAPSLDLPLDIRWGRVYETFGDNARNAGMLGVGFVTGSQEVTNGGDHVLATAKHYLGVGSMVWGTSMNKNFSIDQGKTPDDEDLLRRYYLPPFRQAIDSGALCVMAGLNTWGDTHVSASAYLLTDVLKRELGFKGFVVSDWYGVHAIRDSEYDALVTGIRAGIDMVMLPFDYKSFIYHLERAVSRGDVSEERIDDAVRRILRAKFTMGLFDRTPMTEPNLDVVGSDAHRALARSAVAESLVLLKHDGTVLPLSRSARGILVAGSGADNAGRQMGAWTVEWQGVDGNWVPGVSTVLDGIRTRVASGTQVLFDARGMFPKSTRAEVGIVVVSEKPYAEGWGDNPHPTLSDEDLTAIRNTKAHVDTLIVIILSGRPLIITSEMVAWDVLIAGWLPGSEGEGVADVLFGSRPFSGTLPMPWPRSVEQLPMTLEGVGADGTAPLFPRGYGLRSS